MTLSKTWGSVSISTTEDLYAAVNDPANEGVTIDLLAKGSPYVLTPFYAPAWMGKLTPRPNMGSLILQPGMVLRGHNQYVDLDGDGVWDPPDSNQPEIYADPATETIIDAGQLTGLTGPMNVITLGSANGVESVTVRNNTAAGALIGVTLQPSVGGLQGFVRDCIVENGQRGLRAQHSGSSFSGLHSNAVFERNISRHHRQSDYFNFGIEVQNVSVANATWNVLLRNNRAYDNRFGVFVETLSSLNAQAFVLSWNNIYEKNAVGAVLQGGRDAAKLGFPEGSHGCKLRFDSAGDAIWNNNSIDPGPIGTGGGVDARAAWRTSDLADSSSRNHMTLQFIGTRFIQGSGTENLAWLTGARLDMTVYGALGTGGIVPGSPNDVELLIRRSLSDGSPHCFLLTDSDPPNSDPNELNQVEIMGSAQVIASANVGITLEHK